LRTNCDSCLRPLDLHLPYFPKGSRRGMQVYVCDSCGLVQSCQEMQDTDTSMRISCDADWGNVRHGKSLRFSEHKKYLAEILHSSNILKVLDIGSSDGSLANWLSEAFPDIVYVGVEPHEDQVRLCSPRPNAKLINAYLEEISFDNESFDLIYCSHTLEHAISARNLLTRAYDLLAQGGILFLEVPSLAGLSDAYTVEEYFIDKHNYHFDHKTLTDLMYSCGFSLVSNVTLSPSDLNLTYVFRKTALPKNQRVSSSDEYISDTRSQLKEYSARLARNRLILKRVVNEKLIPLSSRMKVAYWGAGRLFDALCKYGGLNQEHVFLLVDKHLSGRAESINQIPIQPVEAIRMSDPQAVIILARSSANQIRKEAHRFGIRNIISLYDLIEQVKG